MEIIARGGIDQLAKLTAESFQATVRYQALLEDSATSVAPALDGPPGIRIVSRKPDRPRSQSLRPSRCSREVIWVLMVDWLILSSI